MLNVELNFAFNLLLKFLKNSFKQFRGKISEFGRQNFLNFSQKS